MRIDNEFKSLIPPLSAEERKQLEENIIEDGIRDPLVVATILGGEEVLIDGHNRYEIAQRYGYPYEIVRMEFESREQVIEWIILNQFGRRNLPAYERAKLALRLKPMMAEEAKKTQGYRSDILENSPKSKDTRKQIASIAGVSDNTIRRVEYIENHGTDEVKQKARSGEISINDAFKRTVPKPEKHDALAEAKQEHEEFKAAEIVSVADIRTDKQNMVNISFLTLRRLTRASESLTEGIAECTPELINNADIDSAKLMFLTLKDLNEKVVNTLIQLEGRINGKV